MRARNRKSSPSKISRRWPNSVSGSIAICASAKKRCAGTALTPQQYQLLLALKRFPGRDWATMQELADRLQQRHHSVVELVNRAQGQGLVQRAAHPSDRRAVRVAADTAGRASPDTRQRAAPRRIVA